MQSKLALLHFLIQFSTLISHKFSFKFFDGADISGPPPLSLIRVLVDVALAVLANHA